MSSCFVFPQAPFRVTNVPGHASAGIIQLRNCTLASWGGSHRWLCYSDCIGVVVWSFMFCWTCRFILGHVPCKFWKVCLGLSIFHRSIMEETDLLGCSPRIGYHWCVAWWACSALLLGCPVCSSDMDALMRSLGGRTVPDGAVGIYQHLWW